MPRKVAAWLALVAMAFNGCAIGPERQEEPAGGRPVVEDISVAQVPHEGDYALYRRSAHPEQGPPPDEGSPGSAQPEDGPPPAEGPPGSAAALGELHGMFDLWEKAPVGFEKGADGQLFAVVGEDKIPLPPGNYSWRTTEGEPAPKVPLTGTEKVKYVLCRTGETVGEIVLVVIGVAVCAGVVALFVVCMAHSQGGQ
jgi:hypothetical protein